MKNPIAFCCFFIVALFAIPLQAQNILWEKSFGGKHCEILTDYHATTDKGFIVGGSAVSGANGNKTEKNHGNLDYWITKLNESGDIEWQKSYGGSGNEYLKKSLSTSDGGFIIAGTSNSEKGAIKIDEPKGQEDLWIIKTDAKGTIMWQKTIGGASSDQLESILITADGGYLIGASTLSDISGDVTQKNSGNLDYWVLKLDAKGNIEWQKMYGGYYADQLVTIKSTKNKGYLVAGTSNSPQSGNKTASNYGENDFWIIQIDEKGTVLWQNSYGGTKDDQLTDVILTKNGNYCLAGSSNSDAGFSKNKDSDNGTDFWYLQLDTTGTILSQNSFNFGAVDILKSIEECADGNLLIGGYIKNKENQKKANQEEGLEDYVSIKINTKGEEVWSKTIGSNGKDSLHKISETSDGSKILVGTSDGATSRDKNSGVGNQDFWIVKLRNEPKKPEFTITASPNPTDGATTIAVGYDFQDGTVTVVDLAGHVLQDFNIQNKNITIDLSSFAEGVYIVNVKTNVQSDGVKIIKTN